MVANKSRRPVMGNFSTDSVVPNRGTLPWLMAKQMWNGFCKGLPSCYSFFTWCKCLVKFGPVFRNPQSDDPYAWDRLRTSAIRRNEMYKQHSPDSFAGLARSALRRVYSPLSSHCVACVAPSFNNPVEMPPHDKIRPFCQSCFAR